MFKQKSKDIIVTISGKSVENITKAQHLINEEISKIHGHQIKAMDIRSQEFRNKRISLTKKTKSGLRLFANWK